ncbi:hypothetical protein ACFLTU_02775 [Bacteroidota bacterium]
MKRMIKKIMLVIVILIELPNTAFSQNVNDNDRKQSALQLGLSIINMEDNALNNVMHSGSGIFGAWHLERSDNKSVKDFDLEFASGFLKSDFESETATYRFSGSAGFSWLRNLSKNSSDLNFYLGGKGEIKTAIEYFDNWDESHFYWMTAYSAGIDFRFDHSFGTNSRIRIEGDMPVFSLASRPPAEFLYTQSSPSLKSVLGDLNHDLGVLFPTSYLDFHLQVKYSLWNPKKFMPAIFWKLNYLNFNKGVSNSMKYIDQTIGVEYIF